MEDSNRLNMQLLHKQTHTAGINCSGSTFNETGVISQASVGGYCTAVYKKERKETTSTMTLRTYLHFALNSFKEKVPANRNPSSILSHSVCFAVDGKLISSVFPYFPFCESGSWSKLCIKSNIRAAQLSRCHAKKSTVFVELSQVNFPVGHPCFKHTSA